MPKDNLIYLRHILDRSEKILLFTAGMDEEGFMKDEKTQSAVIRELEVIGEATKRLTEDFRNQYPDIPWKLIAGMRDVLIHDYEGVDMLSVWSTITKNVPGLLIELRKINK